MFTYVLTSDGSPVSSISKNLRVKHRTFNIPDISIALYLKCIFECSGLTSDGELASKVEKCFEIVNKCCDYKVLSIKEMNSILKRVKTEFPEDFKEQLTELMIEHITQKVVLDQDNKNMISIVRGIMLNAEIVEPVPKIRARIDKDCTNLLGVISEVLSKKNLCVVSGPHNSGRQCAIGEAFKAVSEATYHPFMLNTLPTDVLLGCYHDELWK